MFYQIFLSSQVKQSMILSNKNCIVELSYTLPNDLRLRIVGKFREISKLNGIVA